MHMSFWFDSVFKNFLFRGYNITSTGGLIATCLGLASLAAILEIIKVYRASIYLKKIARNRNRNVSALQNHAETSNSDRQRNFNDKFQRLAVHTTWFTVQDIIGYVVMLSVMTFNGYFTIAVIFGSAFGYFMFGPWLLELRLNAGTVCSKQQKCAVCVAKMEQSHLLSSSSDHNFDAVSNDTNNSLLEVAEGLASVMQSSSEERIAVEVHSQEHCT